MSRYILSQPWETTIESWQAYLRVRGLSAATRKLRRDHVRFVARHTDTAAPAAVTADDLHALLDARPYSNEHRKAMRASLNSFFGWCVEQELVSENVALALPMVKAPTPAPRPAPDYVWEQLLANCNARERLIALLAGEAGLRRAEIAVVHADDILTSEEGMSLIVHGKGNKQRIVPLTIRLASEVRGQNTGSWLFPGQIDGHISPHYVGQLISKLMPTGWSIHKLRHRFATRGYAGTGNLRAVQEALGHASVATTQRYTAVSSLDVRRVAEAASNTDKPKLSVAGGQ